MIGLLSFIFLLLFVANLCALAYFFNMLINRVPVQRVAITISKSLKAKLMPTATILPFEAKPWYTSVIEKKSKERLTNEGFKNET